MAATNQQQFCLRWNNYQTNLMQVFDQLLHTESFVDVTLSCDGSNIKAHRMVLSACSPYFQLLLADAPCSHPVIILQGVKFAEMKAIVEFMYKGEINICQDQLGSLLRVAESLKIRGLAEVDGESGDSAVLTSPRASPASRALLSALNDDLVLPFHSAARKRRRLSGDDLGSRPCSPATPTSAPDSLETSFDLAGQLGRSSSVTSVPLPGSPAALSTLAGHIPGPMPPPAPMPPHIPHLPPLSPLLNMHSLPRHHAPDDFEIRPGIAEMIREEERRRRDAPDMAKLLESSHHWISNPMADNGGPVFPSMFPDPPDEFGTTSSPPSCFAATSSSSCVAVSSATSTVNAVNKLSPPPQPPSYQLVSKNTSTTTTITSAITTPQILPTATSFRSSPPSTVGISSTASCPPCTIAANSVHTARDHGSGANPADVTRLTSCVTVPKARPSVSCHLGRNISSSETSPSSSCLLSQDTAWEEVRGAVSAPKSGASRWTQSDLMAALSLVKSGTPIKPAAERCNIPVMTLWRRTRALGIVSSKVQCGFRYPAARRRSRVEPETSSSYIKQEQVSYPNKIENDYCTKEDDGHSNKTESPSNARHNRDTTGKVVVSPRGGPLREMSTLHTVGRPSAKEKSPRPSGRENRESSPRFTCGNSNPWLLFGNSSQQACERENSCASILFDNASKVMTKDRSLHPYINLNSLSIERDCADVKEKNLQLKSQESSPTSADKGHNKSVVIMNGDDYDPSVSRVGSPMSHGKDRCGSPQSREGCHNHYSGKEKLMQLMCSTKKRPPLAEQNQLIRNTLQVPAEETVHAAKETGSRDSRDTPGARTNGAASRGDADRFRAWVDIVLEGAGRHQQQDIPQDLTTDCQHLASSVSETSSSMQE